MKLPHVLQIYSTVSMNKCMWLPFIKAMQQQYKL